MKFSWAEFLFAAQNNPIRNTWRMINAAEQGIPRTLSLSIRLTLVKYSTQKLWELPAIFPFR